MICKDPLADLLKNFGYNLVALPKPDIAPLQLLAKTGSRLERIGKLSELFIKSDSVPLPQVSKDIPLVKELNNKQSSGIDAKIGLQIMANFLQKMLRTKDDDPSFNPRRNPAFELAFANARSFVFSYKDVLMNEINLIRLDEYIQQTKLSPHAATMREHLEKGNLFVITSTIKSNSFSTEVIGKNNASIEVDIPNIAGIVGGNVRVGRNRESSNEIVYSGEENLVFGFKAMRILCDDKRNQYKLRSTEGIVLRGEEDFPVDPLQLDVTFAEI